MQPSVASEQKKEILVQTQVETNELHHKKNIYPLIRHILIVAITLVTVSIMLFLIYQNGKSIYDNGL